MRLIDVKVLVSGSIQKAIEDKYPNINWVDTRNGDVRFFIGTPKNNDGLSHEIWIKFEVFSKEKE